MGKNSDENIDEQNIEEQNIDDAQNNEDGEATSTKSKKVEKSPLQRDLDRLPKIRAIIPIVAGVSVCISSLILKSELLKTCYALIMALIIFYILGEVVESTIVKHITAKHKAIEEEKERQREEEFARRQEEERLLLLERENQVKLEIAEAGRQEADMQNANDAQIADAIKQAIS